METGRRKFVVFGLDGATPEVLFPLARSGHLPHFGRMMEEGVWGRLRSTIHPLTPQAWATFVTGMNPGKHGIYDFGQRRAGAYSIELVNSTHRRAQGLYSAVSAAKMTAGTVNIPMSYPPEQFGGFNVTGMHTPTLDKGVWPPDLYAEIVKTVPDYRIDVMCHWYEGYGEFIRDVHEMMDRRMDLVEYLFRRFSPDLFIPVFVGVDRMQHALWNTLEDPDSLEGGKDLSKEILKVYKKSDDIFGRMVELAGEDANFLVMSDHGFGSLKKDVYLNNFLRDLGLLRFDPVKVRSYRPPEPAVESSSDPRHSWHRDLLNRSEAGALPEDDEAVARGEVPARLRTFETVDWKRTRAYSHGLFGNIFVNLRGREPEGSVAPGREYEEVRSLVRSGLEKLRDPDDGLPVVDAVYDREDLYWGPQFEKAPDLLVVMRNYSYMTRGACEFLGDGVFSAPAVNHSGNHRMHGVLLARGPDIDSGKEVRGIGLEDLAPTMLFGMGISGLEFDGKIAKSIYNNKFIEHRERDLRPVKQVEEYVDPVSYDDHESDLIRERLRSLGYLK